jgi:hypothetical protein
MFFAPIVYLLFCRKLIIFPLYAAHPPNSLFPVSLKVKTIYRIVVLPAAVQLDCPLNTGQCVFVAAHFFQAYSLVEPGICI